MTTAFVLMTALPPHSGHMDLIRFANDVGDTTKVIVCTQPAEPYPFERFEAVREACLSMPNVNVVHIHRELPQEPEDDPGFWDMWTAFLYANGLTSADYIVASEKYGQTLAEVTGSTFVPYDVDRSFNITRANTIRTTYPEQYSQIIPEFRHNLVFTVTMFGAESTGKSTLTKEISRRRKFVDAMSLFEWARPYMEKFEPVVTEPVMNAIWKGQKALQLKGRFGWSPLVLQDTDLYSTVGYWDMWGPKNKLPGAPAGLLADAEALKSDLYIITRSNIPFEHDAIRFGGAQRETTDQYWIDLCDKFGLNYRILNSKTKEMRAVEAEDIISEYYSPEDNPLATYVRAGEH